MVIGAFGRLSPSGDQLVPFRSLEMKAQTLSIVFRPHETARSLVEVIVAQSCSGSSVLALAIVMVYLILAALYERWRLPSAVVLAVPFAVAGALALVTVRGMENDIYFQIGLVVLIGLAAKNAILIVEFAQQGLLSGMSARDAAVQAARLRFRPIVMTSLAFVSGVMPLAIADGAGAAARRSMGTGVVGGMLIATFVATVFVPLFFTWFARRRKAGDPVEAPAARSMESR